MKAKFILNRPDDSMSLSRRALIGTTLKWFFLLMVGAALLRAICIAVYMAMGVNPMGLTTFAGSPTARMDNASWQTIAHLLIVAPVLEEVTFRLGLSFKRATVSLWVGLLPIVSAFYLYHCRVWYVLVGLLIVGALLAWLVYHHTADDQWKVWRKKYVIPAMWISAIGFGLMHLMAFSVLNWQVLPFALATILIPMAGGCAVTYTRVSLGFWWGVLLHCIINIPGVLMIASAM